MYKCKSSIVLRNIHGSFFLIDITAKVQDDICLIYEINSMGAFVWRQLLEGNSFEKIANNIKSNINEPPAYTLILKDVEEFANKLCEKGFITNEEKI